MDPTLAELFFSLEGLSESEAVEKTRHEYRRLFSDRQTSCSKVTEVDPIVKTKMQYLDKAM